MNHKIAIITYESPFAPCGGIAAVTSRLPTALQTASGLQTIVVTPFHHKIKKTTELAPELQYVGQFNIRPNVTMTLKYYKNKADILWYFIMPNDLDYFAGVKHPYDVKNTLKRDSLTFGAAVSKSLPLISANTKWILMMQDWEAATTVLALANKQDTYKLFITLHNSYDSGEVTAIELEQAGLPPYFKLQHYKGASPTVLERALSLVTTPVFTVSHQFARELTSEILHTNIMAPHLQALLRNRVRGIDNGPFVKLSVSENILTQVFLRKFEALQFWKKSKRELAIKTLQQHTPTPQEPIWGNLSEFSQVINAQWFILAGRDDVRQKGYDVAVLAIDKFLAQGGNGQFLFFPIPSDAGLERLQFLYQLAEKYPANIIALPFLNKVVYEAARYGACYAIMPSLYEPFGMVSEFYLNGVVGIGRATGGILQRIVPLQAASSYSSAVHNRSTYWHPVSVQPTGFLYRETDEITNSQASWQTVNNSGIHLSDRQYIPLIQSMADELCLSIQDAVRVYTDAPQLYYDMLLNGTKYIQQSLSWDKAAQEYVRYIMQDY